MNRLSQKRLRVKAAEDLKKDFLPTSESKDKKKEKSQDKKYGSKGYGRK